MSLANQFAAYTAWRSRLATYIGVMAQDVLQVAPDAVCLIDGFYHVYYDKLGTSLRIK